MIVETTQAVAKRTEQIFGVLDFPDKDPAARFNVVIYTSIDNGLTWQQRLAMNDIPGNHEPFSPAIAEVRDKVNWILGGVAGFGALLTLLHVFQIREMKKGK